MFLPIIKTVIQSTLMKQLQSALGSTGSIGNSTLGVVRANPELFNVTVLVAGRNVEQMAKQCLEFSPRYAAMSMKAGQSVASVIG